MTTRVSVGFVCDVGVGDRQGGRDKNEDNLLVCEGGKVTWWEDGVGPATQAQAGEGVILAVCDGLGGHANGEVAAGAAVRVLSKLYQPDPPKNVVRVLMNYVHDAHRSLHRTAAQTGPVTLGTTLTVGWILGPHLHWVHVGDSRIYLVRGGKAFQLSADHTRNEFARRDGRPPVAEGDRLAQSFIFGSRGLGNDQGLRIEKGIDAGTEPLEVGDLVLLCSDGLHGSVTGPNLSALLDPGADPQVIAKRLLAAALAAGSSDNVTAIVARIEELPERDDDWSEDPDVTVSF